MDVLVKNAKREAGWQSFILEEPHIVFWCLCYFLCFCYFVGYGIQGDVLYGMSMPKSDVGGGTLFPRFLLFDVAWFANGREEGAWWGEEINTWWGGKLNTLVFSLNFSFSIRIVCVKSFSRRMLKAWTLNRLFTFVSLFSIALKLVRRSLWINVLVGF